MGCWGGHSGRLESVWRVKWQEFEEADVEVLFRDAGVLTAKSNSFPSGNESLFTVAQQIVGEN